MQGRTGLMKGTEGMAKGASRQPKLGTRGSLERSFRKQIAHKNKLVS